MTFQVFIEKDYPQGGPYVYHREAILFAKTITEGWNKTLVAARTDYISTPQQNRSKSSPNSGRQPRFIGKDFLKIVHKITIKGVLYSTENKSSVLNTAREYLDIIKYLINSGGTCTLGIGNDSYIGFIMDFDATCESGGDNTLTDTGSPELYEFTLVFQEGTDGVL